MAKWQVLVFVLGVAAAAASAAPAADPAFDVKPGLWETTTSGSMSGAPPIPPDVLAQMSPDQRSKVEAAIARANGTRTRKSCLTAEQLRRGPNLAQPDSKSCTQSIVTRTATELEIRQVCTNNGAQTMSGTVRFQAVNRETVTGTADFSVNNGGGGTTRMQHKISGRWLGADCGSIKPPSQ